MRLSTLTLGLPLPLPVNQLILGVAVLLVLMLVGGLSRILRGPSHADRMLAAQLFGTTAVGVLLLLGEVSGLAGVQDAALVLALLAAISVVAFAQGTWGGGGGGE